MDPTSNFLSYRTTLKAAISRSEGATDQRQRIIIPFFSLLIKDLFIVNEATASRLANGHINFAKARQLAQKLKEFAIWKDVDCPYAKTPVVAEFLQFSPTWSEKGQSFWQKLWRKTIIFIEYRTRANRPPTFYLLNQFFGPDFEISDCKNAYKTSANPNETSSISFSWANSSKNDIKARIGQQRGVY